MSHSECWVIGSAPHKIVNTSLDIIAVNHESEKYPNAKYHVTVEIGFWKDKEKADKFNGLKVFVLSLHGSVKDGLIVRDEAYNLDYDMSAYDMIVKSRKVEGLSRSFKDFRNNANSGLAAFQFALCLGYKTIHLVGLELKGEYSFAYDFLAPEIDKVFRQVYPDVKVINHCENSRFTKVFGYEPI